MGHQNKKQFVNVRVAAVALMLLWGLSYVHFVNTAKNVDTQVFDLKKTFSWKATPQGIFRVDARGSIDTTVLSRAVWRDFDWSFFLLNPRNCGVIYNRKDENNFYFIFFNTNSRSMVLGRSQGGRPEIFSSVRYDFPPVLSCRLKASGNTVAVSVNDKDLPPIPVDNLSGRLGLVLNDADIPKTVFNRMRVSGHVASGNFVKVEEASTSTYRMGAHLWSVAFLYLVMLAMSFFLARGFPWPSTPYPKLAGINDKISMKWVWLLHLGATVFIFWPFVFKGAVLISSSDNFGEIFPLFFLSKHNFAQILSGKSLCLWNPLTHNGIPFFTNHWNMIYYPLNWPIFFVPDA